MKKVVEYAETDYKEFFEWLLEKDVHINMEPDITLLNTHEKPYIYYPDEIKLLLESDAMQRLSRITQLGTTILINHTTYHTRLAHSKGAGNNATKFFIKQFKKDENWRKKIEDANLKLEVLADIIQMYTHDIGHNILSHALEKLIESDRKKSEFGAAHEILGRRILNNDKQIIEILNSINPDLLETLNKVSAEEYSLRALKEGAVDWDRLDFLIRDTIYNGICEDRQTVEEIIENTEIEPNQDIPTYREKVKPQIKNALIYRGDRYKNVYCSNVSEALEKTILYFCEKLQQSDYDCDLKTFINNCQTRGGDGIDLDEFLKWDDIRYYNELIRIAKECPDENLKGLSICCLPNLKSLRNVAYELLGMDKGALKDLSGYKLEFFQNVKKLISEKDEVHTRLKNKKDGDLIILDADSKEDVKQVLNCLEAQGIERKKLERLISWEKHIKNYDNSDPIYIKQDDGKIENLNYELEFGSNFQENVMCGVLALPIQMNQIGFSDKEVSMVCETFEAYNQKNRKSNKSNLDEKMVYEMEDMLHKRNYVQDERLDR